MGPGSGLRPDVAYSVVKPKNSYARGDPIRGPRSPVDRYDRGEKTYEPISHSGQPLAARRLVVSVFYDTYSIAHICCLSSI